MYALHILLYYQNDFDTVKATDKNSCVIRKNLVEILGKQGIIKNNWKIIPVKRERNVNKMHMTEQIIRYIQKNALSMEDIAKATGVELSLLQEQHRSLNATELLEICNYLQMDPWMFYEEMEKKE